MRQQFHVGIDHDLDQFAESHLRFPIENPFRLARVADEQIHLRRPLVARVVLHVFLPVEIDAAESDLEEFAERMGFVRREHVVIAFVCCSIRHIPSTYSVA